MAGTDLLERAVFEAAISDQVTGPARAVTQAFANMAAGAETVARAQEELVTSSARSAEATRRRYFEEEKLAAKVEQVNRKLAQEQQNLNRLLRDRELSEEHVARAMEKARYEADRAIRNAQERIARERTQMEAYRQSTRAAEDLTRSEADLTRARAQALAGISAQTAALTNLRAKYDPLFAAQRQHMAALREIAELEQAGSLTAEKAAASRAQLIAAYREEKQELSGLAALDRQREQALREQAQAAEEAAKAQQRAVTGAADFARSLGDLRAKYDPLFAAQRQHRQALQEVATLEKAGILTADQAAASRARLGAALRETAQQLSGTAALERQQAQAEEEAAQAAKRHAAEIDRLKASLTGYVQSLDPIAASLAQVEQAERELMQLRRAGAEASPAQVAAVVRMREKHEEMAAAANKAGGALRLQRHELTNLTYQIQDAIVQLAGGQNPFLILIQQGPQATGAVGGTANAIKLIRQEITPTRVAVVGLTAVMAALMLAANAQEGALGGLRSQLRGVTTDYAGAAQEVENAARRISQAGLGINRQQARDGVVSLMQAAPRGSNLDFEALARDAADLAAVLKTDTAGGFDALTRAMRDPAALVQELAERRFPGMTRQLLGNVEALVAHNQKADAFTLVMSRLRPQISGAATDVSPLTKVLRELSSEWDSFLEKAASGLGGAGISMLRDLRDLLSLVERALELAKQIPGLRQFAEIASAGPVEAGLAARRSLGLGVEGATNRALGQLGTAGPATPGAVAAQRVSVPWSVPADLRDHFARASVEAKIDVDLLARVFAREGVRNRDGSWRESSAGAIGPMQVMPGTFADMARKYGIEGTVGNEGANIRAAARYLAELVQRFPDDLPRAIAAYNAGPDRPGLGSPALGGNYARRVLDGYSGTGLTGTVTIQSQRTEVTSNEAPRSGGASPDVAAERALMLARGEVRPEPHASRESQLRFYQGAMREIEEARRIPGLSEANLDILTNGYRNLAKAAEAAKGPQEAFLEGLGRTAEAARIYDPAQRALNEAVTEYEERMRAAGEVPTDEGRNAARALKLQELGAAYVAASIDAQRANEAQDRMAAAWQQGQQAVQRLAAEEKAREVVRAAGIQGEQAQAEAVRKLADAYELAAAKQADNALRAQNSQAQDNLDYLEKERSLIAASADERERELAAFRARQQAVRSGARDAGTIEEAERLARSTADSQRETKQLQSSWEAVGSIVTDTADTVRTALVSAIATGEARTIKFGNVFRAVVTSAVSKLGELALLNPISNAFTGGSLPTLGGAMTAATSRGSAAGGGGGGGGFSLGSLGGLSNFFGMGGGSLSAGLDAWGASNLGFLGFGSGSTAAATSAAAGGDFIGAGMEAVSGVANVAPAGLLNGGSMLGGFSSFSNVLGIAGAALPGLMSGNYVQAGMGLGGAALGTMLLPGVGTMIGGLAGNLLGGLFGGKEKNPASSVQIGIDEAGQLTVLGSKAKHMSADEGVAQTKQALDGMNKLIAGMGLSLTSTNGEVVANTYQGKDAWRNEDAQRSMTQAILERLTGGTDSMMKVRDTELNRAREGDGDLSRAIENMGWAKTVYDVLGKAPEQLGTYAAAVKLLDDTYAEAVKKAQELGLATQALTDEQARRRAELDKQRDQAVRDAQNTLEVRTLNATGRGEEAVFRTFDLNATRETEETRKRLEDLGATAEQVGDVMGQLAQVLAQERQSLVDQQAQARKQTALAYWQASREAEGRGYINSVEGVRLNYQQNAEAMRKAGVNPEALYHQQLSAVLDTLSAEQLTDVMNSFRGLDDAATNAAEEVLRLGNSVTKAAEAADKAARIQAGGSIRAYVDGVRASSGAGYSPEEQLRAAQEQFGRDLALARGGDQQALGRITSTADNLLSAGRGMWGSGAEFGQMREWVLSSLEQLPATRDYDAEILAELKKLGGRIDVSVELETVRVISETLQGLPDSMRDRLIQAETVLRTVEERLGRALTDSERGRLIDGELVLRDVQQALKRDLTAAERAGLVASGDVLRAIEQKIGRPLTAAEVASLVQSGEVSRSVQEALGRALTGAERAALTNGGAVLRSIEEALGRQLTATEAASLIHGETVRRLVEQAIGRNLTAAERGGLVDSASVIRTIEQRLGRGLTAAERATLLEALGITRTINQVIGRNLTAAERASLAASDTVLQKVEQQLGRTLTERERSALVDNATVVRLVQEQLGRTLGNTERAQLLAAGNVQRLVEERLGRTLTATELAALQQPADIVRTVKEALGRTLTAAEEQSLAEGGEVLRLVEEKLGRTLTTAERGAIIASATVERTITQAIGRDLSAAERAGLVGSDAVLRVIEQQLGRQLTAAERAQLVAGGDVSRSVQERLGAQLSAADRAALTQGGTVLRQIEQQMGRPLTEAERAALVPAGAVQRTITQHVESLKSQQRAKLAEIGTVQRTIEQRLGRVLTPAELAQLVAAATVQRTVTEALGRSLTAAERASLTQGATVLRSLEERLGRALTAAERAALTTGGSIARSVEEKLGRRLTDTERASLAQGGTVLRQVEQQLGRKLTDAEKATLVTGGTIIRRVDQAVETKETVVISRSVDEKIGKSLEVQNSLLSAIKASGSTQTQMLRTLDDRLGNIDTHTYVIRQLGRGLGGGLRVTTNETRGGAFNGMDLPDTINDNTGIKVNFAAGGVIGERVTYSSASGAFHGEIGEEGPEAVFPLERTPDGDLGVRAILPAAPTPSGVPEMLAELQALRRQMAAQARELAALRAQIESQGEATVAAVERTADAAEDTAATNREMARKDRAPVGLRAGAR